MDAKTLKALKRRLTEFHRQSSASHAAYDRLLDAYHGHFDATGKFPPHPVRPPPMPFPDELRSLPCGARTRAGAPCKLTTIYKNGRCKLHGGLSTGPKSSEGVARALENLKKRWNPTNGREMLSLAEADK
jgi:hypothetical protein